jgi:cardiolipin synthase
MNTAAQLLLIGFVLVDRTGEISLALLINLTVFTVAALTVISASAYVVEWLRHMAGGNGNAREGRR